MPFQHFNFGNQLGQSTRNILRVTLENNRKPGTKFDPKNVPS